MDGIRRVFRVPRSDVERDVDEELRFHIDSRTDALVRQGIPPDSARLQALREFGDVGAARGELVIIDNRQLRSRSRAEWWRDVAQDARVAIRGYARRPAFTAVVLLTLALAIGANSAIFSVAEAVLLRGLPYRDSERLVHLWETQRNDVTDRSEASYPDYIDWLSATDVFSGLAGYNGTNVTVADANASTRERGLRVTPNFFTVLGVQPQRGRAFLDGEDHPDGSPIVVISHEYWQRQFGGDSAVGRPMNIDGRPHVVVGILPSGFRFAPAGEIELWFTLGGGDRRAARGNHWVNVVARLQPGVSLDAARARMTAVMNRLAAAYPETNSARGIVVEPLREVIVGPVRPTLVVLIGAVAIVLIIACANVGSLVLTRSIERGGEIAVRTALGASRRRLIRQLVTENVLIAVAGGALGAWIAWHAVRALVAVASPEMLDRMPQLRDAGVNLTVLAFTLALACLTGIAFGLAPALLATHRRATDLLRGGARAGTSRGRRRLRDALVACEIACTVVLVVAATLMARSLGRLMDVHPGFVADRVVTSRIALAGERYQRGDVQQRFFEGFVARVRALPGVRFAGAVTNPPLQGGGTNTFRVEGQSEPPASNRPEATMRGVAGEYFSAMGIPLVAGRFFTAQDDSLRPYGIIVNESLARRFVERAPAVGAKLRFYAFPDSAWEIIGVVGDVKTSRLDAPAPHTVYYSHLQAAENRMTVVAKTTRDERALLGEIRRVARAMDPALPVYDMRTMRQQIGQSPAVSARRYPMLLIGAFAVAALALAIVGVYGVIAYSVAQRTRELALRVALGATNGNVIALILKRGALLALVGIGVGLLAALVLSRSLGALLYDVSATDGATYAGVAILLGLVALLASYIPSRRATRVDPATALRAE